MRHASDPLGNASSLAYDATGNLTGTTDPLGRTTSYAYNSMGQLATIANALGQITSFTYDAVGSLTASTDPRGSTSTYAYTPRNELASATDPLGRTTAYAYDAVGNLATATDPLGNSTASAYDALNRLTQLTDPLGNASRWSYDAVGNLTTTTDPLGAVTTYDYDGLDRLTRTIDALANTTSLAYDANSRLTSVTDALGRATGFTYNQRGQPLSITNPLSQTWTRTYDAKGRLASTSDPKGQATAFTYDGADRLTRVAYAGGITVSYTYDAASALASRGDNTGTTAYTRDALARLTGVASPDGAGGSKTVGYAYDPAGNRTSLTYPDGKQVSYAYDAANQLTTITDWAGGTAALGYDAAGRLTGLSLPNGAAEGYSYDAASRLTEMLVTRGGGGLLEQLSYAYDARGRRTGLSDSEGASAFSYDGLDRLTGATYPKRSVGYAYDAVGNRAGMTVAEPADVVNPPATTTYAYDAADRLTSTSGPQGTTSYSYDANGNLVARGADTFTWDGADRLVGATVEGVSATMAYDGDHNLVTSTQQSAVSGQQTTRYLHDPNLPLPQVLVEGDTSYLYGPGMAAGYGPLMQDTAGNRRWLHADALGSVRLATDESGSATATSSYDAFGSPRLPGGDLGRFGFAGQQTFPDLGLQYMRARWYDPATGRFLSQDPVPGSASSPQTLNPYAYAGNNPCNARDPSGLAVDYPGTGLGELQLLAPLGAGAGGAAGAALSNAASGDPLPKDLLGAAGVSECIAAAATAPPEKATPIVVPVFQVPRFEGPLGLNSVFAYVAKVLQAAVTYLQEWGAFFQGWATKAVALLRGGSGCGKPDNDCATSLGGTVSGSLVFQNCLNKLALANVGPFGALVRLPGALPDSGSGAGGLSRPVRRAESAGTKGGPQGAAVRNAPKEPPLAGAGAPQGLSKPTATNPRLRRAIDELYRTGADVGTGSTAEAVRHERRTGELLSPSGHKQKAIERTAQLQRILREEDLSPSDRASALALINDLQEALAGR